MVDAEQSTSLGEDMQIALESSRKTTRQDLEEFIIQLLFG